MTTEKQRKRRIRTPIFLAALLCLAIGSAGNAGAAAFVNGSFETGDTTGWSTGCFTCLTYSGLYGSGFDGSYWAFVGGRDEFAYYEQAVPGLTPGTTYAVDFLIASEWLLADSLFVTENGSSSQLFTAPPWNGNYWDNWVSKEYLFTPTGTSSTIRFSTHGIEPGTQYDIGLDKVSIRGGAISAVPEPTSLLLLGSGLAGLAAWRLKKSA